MSGGGSGGGSSGVKYDNLEKLYGTQQQAAGFMLDQAMPRIPGILNNTEQMVGDAMSGALADQMRGRAAYDANQSIASSNNDAIRKITSYGAAGDPSGGRFADVINQNAFNSAKVRAGSINTANNYAEDQKWNRNAGMYGQVSGMSTGAMQGMSSAGAGLSNLTAQQNQNDMANAKGYGQFGSAIGSAIGSAMTKADGGYIRAPGLAAGGDAWQAYKAANPSASGGLSRRGGGRGQAVAQIFGGAAPHLLGAGLKDLSKGGKSQLISGAKDWYTKLTGPQQISMQGAPEYANAQLAAPDMTGFAPGADMVAGAGSGLDAASSVGAGADAIAASYGAQSLVSSAPAATDAVATAVPEAVQVIEVALKANGGYIQAPSKRGLKLALGGGVRSPIAANGVDNMDANMSMPRVAQMDDKAVSLPSQAQQAAVDTRYMGKTYGRGETSAGDPDGFGSESPDNRHMVGKATLSVIGHWFGGTLGALAGSALAEVLHPVGEAVSRGAITIGDKAGGAVGAFLLDPIGTYASGKYKPEDITKGNLSITAGVPWDGKFFSEGGDVEPQRRADYTPGGKVTGPGTETSDDIPAWLSDGEFVLNKAAVDAIGRDKLEKLNRLGLRVRGGELPARKAKDIAANGLKPKGAKRAKAKQRTA